jgi:hypothetical protein
VLLAISGMFLVDNVIFMAPMAPQHPHGRELGEPTGGVRRRARDAGTRTIRRSGRMSHRQCHGDSRCSRRHRGRRPRRIEARVIERRESDSTARELATLVVRIVVAGGDIGGGHGGAPMTVVQHTTGARRRQRSCGWTTCVCSSSAAWSECAPRRRTSWTSPTGTTTTSAPPRSCRRSWVRCPPSSPHCWDPCS